MSTPPTPGGGAGCVGLAVLPALLGLLVALLRLKGRPVRQPREQGRRY